MHSLFLDTEVGAARAEAESAPLECMSSVCTALRSLRTARAPAVAHNLKRTDTDSVSGWLLHPRSAQIASHSLNQDVNKAKHPGGNHDTSVIGAARPSTCARGRTPPPSLAPLLAEGVRQNAARIARH